MEYGALRSQVLPSEKMEVAGEDIQNGKLRLAAADESDYGAPRLFQLLLILSLFLSLLAFSIASQNPIFCVASQLTPHADILLNPHDPLVGDGICRQFAVVLQSLSKRDKKVAQTRCSLGLDWPIALAMFSQKAVYPETA